MQRLPHITWLRSFEAAARHASFSAAAEELGLTAAAVSQQIRLLEHHLGKPLFVRLPRGVALTDAGKAYAQPIRQAFADMQSATGGLFGAARPRTVRVRASISFAGLVVAPRIAEFHARHPDIRVELTTFVWADRFNDDPADVDIRYGSGDWQDGAVQHLGHEHALPVCHRDFADRQAQPLTIQALAAGRIVRIMGSEGDWAQLSAIHGLKLPEPPQWLTVDSSFVALQTVLACGGAAIVLDRFARHALDSGQLIAPFEHRLPIPQSHFLVRREGSFAKEEVTRFCDWVRNDLCQPAGTAQA